MSGWSRDQHDDLVRKAAILELTLDAMEQGISVFDADLNVVVFNRRFLEILGLPAAIGSGRATTSRISSATTPSAASTARAMSRSRCAAVSRSPAASRPTVSSGPVPTGRSSRSGAPRCRAAASDHLHRHHRTQAKRDAQALQDGARRRPRAAGRDARKRVRRHRSVRPRRPPRAVQQPLPGGLSRPCRCHPERGHVRVRSCAPPPSAASSPMPSAAARPGSRSVWRVIAIRAGRFQQRQVDGRWIQIDERRTAGRRHRRGVHRRLGAEAPRGGPRRRAPRQGRVARRVQHRHGHHRVRRPVSRAGPATSGWPIAPSARCGTSLMKFISGHRGNAGTDGITSAAHGTVPAAGRRTSRFIQRKPMPFGKGDIAPVDLRMSDGRVVRVSMQEPARRRPHGDLL